MHLETVSKVSISGRVSVGIVWRSPFLVGVKSKEFLFFFLPRLLLTLIHSCGTRARTRVGEGHLPTLEASRTHALTRLFRVSVGPLRAAQIQANVALISRKLVKENGA